MRSASDQFLIPAVLRVRMYVSAKEVRTGRLTLSRRNIMLRDKCTCQCVPPQSPLLHDIPSFLCALPQLDRRIILTHVQVLHACQ